MNQTARFAYEVGEQHRLFFRTTGWLMVGAGALAVILGARFVRAGAPVLPPLRLS